jgi:hypothetical protein
VRANIDNEGRRTADEGVAQQVHWREPVDVSREERYVVPCGELLNLGAPCCPPPPALARRHEMTKLSATQRNLQCAHKICRCLELVDVQLTRASAGKAALSLSCHS